MLPIIGPGEERRSQGITCGSHDCGDVLLGGEHQMYACKDVGRGEGRKGGKREVVRSEHSPFMHVHVHVYN